ncbi:MAG: hypothetical protein KY455_12165 [Euryarchaeota archaeon]|nr:hypothetical protein [Euryarchaeota archaeon]
MSRRLRVLVTSFTLALLMVGDLGLHHGPAPVAERTIDEQPTPGQSTSGLDDPEERRNDLDPRHPVGAHRVFAQRADGTSGGLVIECPEGVGNRNDDREVIIAYGCPILVADRADPFANLHLDVDPRSPHHIAIFSLHGNWDGNGPYPYSRSDQAHTVFVSDDGGISWWDNPTHTEPAKEYIPAHHGAEAAGAMDDQGRIYVGRLYTSPHPELPDANRSTIALSKAPSAAQPGMVVASYRDSFVIPSRDEGGVMRSFHLIPLSDAAPANQTDEETEAVPPPSDDSDHGASAEASMPTPDRVYAVWHEKAHDHANSTTNMSAWIDFAWTDTNGENDWTRAHKDDVIGPCKSSSDAVSWDGRIFVACTVERGYTARDRALIGDIDVWEIDPRTNTTRLLSHTGIDGDDPLLAVNRAGHMVVVASRLYGNRTVSVPIAFGYGGTTFSTPLPDIGDALHRMTGNEAVLDARVTALVITDRQSTVLLTYKERVQQMDDDIGQRVEEVLVDDPGDYSRHLVALNQCRLIDAARMHLGTGARLFQGQFETPFPADAFDDIRDGLVNVHSADGRERVHFAINDYGAALYGRVVVEEASEVCAIGSGFPLTPSPAMPQAVSLANPSNSAIGAGIGLVATAMVGYLLTVKRRTASYVTTEAGR